MKSWLQRFNGKKPAKRPVTIHVEAKTPQKPRRSQGKQSSPKKKKLNPSEKVCPTSDEFENSPESLGVESKENVEPSRVHNIAEWADWMKSNEIVTEVYVEPEVEEYEYGIFNFHFNSLRSVSSRSDGVSLDAVAKHMTDMKIFPKEDDARVFCRGLAGEDSHCITAAQVTEECVGRRKYSRVICKRYVKAVYNREIEDILTPSQKGSPSSVARSPSGGSKYRKKESMGGMDDSAKGFALGNTPNTLQRRYSRADSNSDPTARGGGRRYSRQGSTTRNKVLSRIVSRVASRIYSRSPSVDENIVRPQPRKAAVTLARAKKVRQQQNSSPEEDDQLTESQRRQVEDFLKENGYDEY